MPSALMVDKRRFGSDGGTRLFGQVVGAALGLLNTDGEEHRRVTGILVDVSYSGYRVAAHLRR